jgi:hypothetical protein
MHQPRQSARLPTTPGKAFNPVDSSQYMGGGDNLLPNEIRISANGYFNHQV